jgi:RNase P subunit RPR2
MTAQNSPDVSTERVVELLRASNAHSRGLTNAARQLKQLREEGEVKADVLEDAKWQRQTCSNCGRALPHDSQVCPFCVNKCRRSSACFPTWAL